MHGQMDTLEYNAFVHLKCLEAWKAHTSCYLIIQLLMAANISFVKYTPSTNKWNYKYHKSIMTDIPDRAWIIPNELGGFSCQAVLRSGGWSLRNDWHTRRVIGLATAHKTGLIFYHLHKSTPQMQVFSVTLYKTVQESELNCWIIITFVTLFSPHYLGSTPKNLTKFSSL